MANATSMTFTAQQRAHYDEYGRTDQGFDLAGVKRTTTYDRVSGGEGRPRQGAVKVCYGPDRGQAVKTVHRLWPNAMIPGEAAQLLPLTEVTEFAPRSPPPPFLRLPQSRRRRAPTRASRQSASMMTTTSGGLRLRCRTPNSSA